ncbi:MAG: glycoside hydrolase family 15 protein [Candidatus Thermoplasmatota archaeon]|jgi:glucoamylase|nr:glycoside hydrolase family 15 protein [Candidatus Thermoplasmatota archaeon]MCL5790751.1 glycoside hydrolase family 15 protein [Candidatus Thermoplasmatota archaeon]
MGGRININNIQKNGYVMIRHHGLVSNNRTAGLIAVNGDIDWLCLPEFSSDPVFDSILDSNKGGFLRFSILNFNEIEAEQFYDGDTMILITEFYSNNRKIIKITDFMPATEFTSINFPELHRIIEAFEDCDISIKFRPTLDYTLSPLKRTVGQNKIVFSKNDLKVGLFTSVDVMEQNDCYRSHLSKGTRSYFIVSYGMREEDNYTNYKTEQRLMETREFWLNFISYSSYNGLMRDIAIRSALTLRALFHDPSGMMVAAPTSSLPECVGGERNWDYRYSWVRDTSYVIQALAMIGLRRVSTKYLYDMMEIIENDGEEIRVLYGVSRDTKFREIEIDYEGYLGSRPVRLGNLASSQFQLDVYGSFINAIYNLSVIGGIVNSYMWDFIIYLLERINHIWKIPDSSIWEFRTQPRHYTYSKVMCWLGFDRAIKLGKSLNYEGDYDNWQKTADVIKEDIMKNGVDQETGSFTQYYGSKDVDSSLLRIPLTGFVGVDDPVFVRTFDRIKKELMSGDILFRRYNSDDGLKCRDNAFLLMSFWYIEDLILMGKIQDAESLLNKIIEKGNHLHLFSEEIDTETGELIGNFPQAITHLGIIRCIYRLNEAQNRIKNKVSE